MEATAKGVSVRKIRRDIEARYAPQYGPGNSGAEATVELKKGARDEGGNYYYFAIKS